MANDDFKLLYHEILDKVHKAKTKAEKVKILQQHNSNGLRMIIKSSFDPSILWALPEGTPPYEKNDAPDGTEHTVLEMESKKLWHYIKGADRNTPQHRKETMFIQMLESLSDGEAQIVLCCKDKALHRKYKGLSEQVVKEAFGWNDDYLVPEPDKYPQAGRSASGLVDG